MNTSAELSKPPVTETSAAYFARLRATRLADCSVGFLGDFFVVLDAHGREVYREHKQYCHIKTAWEILTANDPAAPWKTAQLLTTLRQALRERYVQPMPLEAPAVGISLKNLNRWLRDARAFDRIHHGAVTF